MRSALCTTCGKPATHLYATWLVEDNVIHSVNGRHHWSPSCDECDDPELVEPIPGAFRITAPLMMWPRFDPTITTDDPPRMNHVAIDDLADAVAEGTYQDSARLREVMAEALRSYAAAKSGMHMADARPLTYEGVLFSVLCDAMKLWHGESL